MRRATRTGSSTVTEHTGQTRRALHIWAEGQHCTSGQRDSTAHLGKGQHCRAALPGGAGRRRKGEIQVEHHCGESRGMFCSLVTSLRGVMGPSQRAHALNKL